MLVAIAVTTMVKGGLKISASEKGIDLGGYPAPKNGPKCYSSDEKW